jgi:cystathionine gamma-synthase
MRPRTLAVHGAPAQRVVGEPLAPPLVPSTSFVADPDVTGFSVVDAKGDPPPFYSRWSNPTVDALERRVALLDGGEAAVCFGSGMGAIAALFLTRLRAGDHLVVSSVCYAGVAELAHDLLARFGVAVSFVDTSDLAVVARALRPTTKLVHVETPANPILRVTDVAAVARLAHEAGAALSVDATIATPLGTRPLALGADFVVHTLTKYACGHGDALAGVVIGRAADLADVRARGLVHVGAVLSPFAAWLVLRGLETLPARMAAHEENARAVATACAGHPAVRRVLWPGLPSFAGHDVARRQMDLFSGVLSLAVDDAAAIARRMADRCRVWTVAVSLGKGKSLAFPIPTADLLRTSLRLTTDDEAAYRAAAGDGVLRLSVGLEDPDDLVEDLLRALTP